jgi:hypothetical protein
MFGVAQLQIMAQRRQMSGLRLARYELVILSVATTSALFFALYVLPANFFIECTGLVSSGVIKGPVTFTFPDIWKSYVLYLPYVLGLWLGMVFPVFFFFLRSIRHDVRSWKALSENARQVRQRTGQDALDEVWRLWLRRYHVLKDVATHYVPVLTFVAALLVLEWCLFHVSATSMGDASGAVAMSLMLLPALLISLIVFTRLYANELEQTENWLREMADQRDDPALESAASEKLKELESYSSSNFFWAVLGSRGYVIMVAFVIANASVTNALPTIWQTVTGTHSGSQITAQPTPAAPAHPSRRANTH